MAVVSCTLARDARRARFFIDSTAGVSGEVPITWQVVTDDQDDGAEKVYNGAKASSPDALPDFYTTYAIGNDVDTNLYLFSVDLEQNATKKTLWTITGTYQNLHNGLTGADANTNPFSRPWKYRIDFETYSVAITEGANLEAITSASPAGYRDENTWGPLVNTALQPFEEVFTEPRTRSVLVAWKNFPSLSGIYSIQRLYGDSLNSSTFLGYPKYHCEFRSIEASELVRESNVEYYVGTVRILLSPIPLTVLLNNKGWKVWELGGPNGHKLVDAVDDNNDPVSEPIFLDSVGGKPDGLPQQDSVEYLTKRNLQDYNGIFN